MKRILIVSFAAILTINPAIAQLDTSQKVVVAASAIEHLKAYKINVNDDVLARKIAISFHHAVLEVDYKNNFIIADITEKEVKKLREAGFDVLVAEAWNDRYKEFRSKYFGLVTTELQKGAIASIPGFECYPTVEETLSQGERLAANYSDLAEWVDIGDSWKKVNNQGGYDLMVLKITNQQILTEKPKLFIHSSMHAREYTPATLNLDFAKLLLEQYPINPDIRWIVDYHEVHLLFHMNPDGRKIAESGISQRKNINDMYCPSGIDNGTVGVDLNRNFAFFWNSTTDGSSGIECDQDFRGISPESEPETKAVSNYIRSIFPDARGPNESDAAPVNTSGMHLDIHSYSQLVLWPYGHTEKPSPNNTGFVALGNKLAWYNNYTPQQSVGLYPTDGTSDDVSYGELGIAALTFELGTSFFQECNVYENTIKPDNLEALVYAAKVSAAPYLLSQGPELIEVLVNSSEQSTNAVAGSQVSLSATASTNQTKESISGPSISKIEYSIDKPVWTSASEKFELSADDSTFNSSVEQASAVIETSNLALGRHTLYLRAYNQNGQAGVVSAVDINISDNNSPIPEFTNNCTDLNCSFDASSSFDNDGTIENYQWSFGDGATALGANQNHTYQNSGNYSVTFTITDNSGNSATKSRNLTALEPVVAIPTPETSSSRGGGTFSGLLLFLVGLICHRKVKPASSSKPSANIMMMIPSSAKSSIKTGRSSGIKPRLTSKAPKKRKQSTGVKRLLSAS